MALAERITVAPDGCWHWTGTVLHTGYGQVRWQGQRWLTHRLIRTLLIGEIPASVTLDHACHTKACDKVGRECSHRRCCNPRHTEWKSRGDNAARFNREKDGCPQGHEYDYVDSRGWRHCTTCANEHRRRRRAAGSKE